jgi:hypothetical protein
MKYFLAHNGKDIFHYREIIEEQIINTGQPNLEYFDTINQLKDRLVELGVNYTEPNNDEYSGIESFDSENTLY